MTQTNLRRLHKRRLSWHNINYVLNNDNAELKPSLLVDIVSLFVYGFISAQLK